MGQCVKSNPFAFNQTCFANNTPGPANDLTVPPPESMFYYLVTRRSMCGESSLGEGRDENGMPTPGRTRSLPVKRGQVESRGAGSRRRRK
jgi:hypothetical protein